jgi:uncharacterized CHY-type Zn-finger protein
VNHQFGGGGQFDVAGLRKGSGKPRVTNKVHFACFACHKSFKQQGSSNWDSNVPQHPFPCPNCKESMARMGRYFKAPPKRAIRAWREVERKYQSGEKFD